MLVFTISWRKKFFSVYAFLGFLTLTLLGCLFFPQNWKVFLYNFIEEVPFPIIICFLRWPYPRALLLLCFLSWCVNIVFSHPALHPYALASLLVSIFSLLFDSLAFSFSIFFPPNRNFLVAVFLPCCWHFHGYCWFSHPFWWDFPLYLPVLDPELNSVYNGPPGLSSTDAMLEAPFDLKIHYKAPNICQNGNRDLIHQRLSP